MSHSRRVLKGIGITVACLVGFLGVVQLIPYGRAHANPPVVQEPTWDSPRTRELAVRACFDCHSNETKWPGYAHVAPFSWVLARDVDAGRTTLNFSEWNRSWDLAVEAGPSVLRREMPPRSYKMMHAPARLSDAETEELARGLDATFGTDRDAAVAASE